MPLPGHNHFPACLRTMKPMHLPWLQPGDPFPDPAEAWDQRQPAPGLLAAGGALDVESLQRAYARGIFPWFSEGQPILWWSTDPRCEIRFDSDFDAVIRACATSHRPGQSGTWIVPAMVAAYEAFYRAGFAHSVETWIDGQLAGGLYCVVVGRAVFGESMFTRVPDASKIALGALVAWCRQAQVDVIDCQQNTRHLASLGAREIPRAEFVQQVAVRARRGPAPWHFDPVYWNAVLPHPTPA